MELHHLVLQLRTLPGHQAQLLDVGGAVGLGVVLAQLGLGGVGAQQGEGDEGAGQHAAQDVLPQLETQIVPSGEQC